MSEKTKIKSVDLKPIKIPDVLKSPLLLLANGGDCDHCLDRYGEYTAAFKEFETITTAHHGLLRNPSVVKLKSTLEGYKLKIVSDLNKKLDKAFTGKTHKIVISHAGDSFYYTLVDTMSNVLDPVQLRVAKFEGNIPVFLPEDQPSFVVFHVKDFESSRVQIEKKNGFATLVAAPLDGFPANPYIVIPVNLHKDYDNAWQLIEFGFNSLLRSMIPGYNRVYTVDIPAIDPRLSVGNMIFTLSAMTYSHFDLSFFTDGGSKKKSLGDPSKTFKDELVKKVIIPPAQPPQLLPPTATPVKKTDLVQKVEPLKRRLDLYLMADISGSMDVTRYLLVQNIVDIVADIKKTGKYDEVWLGCSLFVDRVFKDVLEVDLASNESLRNLMLGLLDVNFDGGAEPLGEAILYASNKFPVLSPADSGKYSVRQKKVIVITDADATGEEQTVWGVRLKDAKFITKRNGVDSDLILVTPKEEPGFYKVALMEQLVKINQFDSLVEFAINSKSKELQREASLALAGSGNKKYLYKVVVESSDERIRLDALEALLHTKDVKLMGILEMMIQTTKDPQIQKRALSVLIASKDQNMMKKLFRETSDEKIKMSVALAFINIREKKVAIQMLSELAFENENGELKEWAKQLLLSIQNAR